MPDSLQAQPIRLLIANVFLASICLAGCSNLASSTQIGTATARAGEVVALATRMGYSAQATLSAGNEQARATARASELELAAAKSWTLQLQDSFDEDLDQWYLGEEEDPALASLGWSIESGGYWWRGKAVDSFVWWVTPDSEDVADFYLTVSIRQIKGPATGEFGVIFRQQDEDHYYLFEVNDSGEYAVYLYTADGWEALIDWSPYSGLHPGETNNLAVLAQGAKIELFINNGYVNSYDHSLLSYGKVGLLAGLSNAGDEATWVFDDFELRTP